MNIKGKAYINGKLINSTKRINVISPLDNQVIGSVPALEKKDLDRAFESAAKSFKTWSITSDEIRIKYLKIFETFLQESKHKLTEIMHYEIAKPIDEASKEIERSIDYLNKTIEMYQIIKKKTVKIDGKTNDIYRVPLGVILAISPFNYPVNLSLSKIIPALISGNTIVFKPATNGSLVGTMLAELFKKANLPKGVINVVTGKGSDIGNHLTTHPLTSMISFTGSVEVGKRIAQHHHLIPLVLELGGNDGAYVRYDANIKMAAKLIAQGAFGFAGQRCTAIKRLIVHDKIKQPFIQTLVDEIKKLPMIPLVNKEAADWVFKLLNHGVKKIIVGGKRTNNQFTNTLVETTAKSLAWTEEAFGPLLPVMYVKDDQQAIKLLNATRYGLQNSLFTSDVDWAKKVALELQCGSVNINAASSRSPDEFPFLGIKDSGFGVQGIKQALISMTRYLNVINNE